METLSAQPQTQTQENQTQDFQLATVFERAIAFIIDFMLWILVSSYIYKFFNTGLTFSTTYSIIAVSIFVAYLTIFTTGRLQTVGKFLLGIKVINRKTKQPLNLLHSFLRAIGYIVNIFTAFLGFAFVFFSKKRLGLEDLLAGSEVITVREKTNTEMTVISALGTILIIISVYFIYNNLIFNPYRAMKESAQQQLITIAYLEELHKQHFGTYTTDLLRLALISGDAVQFQRDMQNNFRPNGFEIGIREDGYYIQGFAKDNANPAKSSMVYLSSDDFNK